MLQSNVKVVQSTRHPNANLQSLFPREGFIVVSTVEVVAKVSIDNEFIDKEPLVLIETISDETSEVRVA